MKTHLKITALIVFLFTLTGCEKLHSTAQVVNLKTTAKNLNQQLPTQLDENTIWTHCSTRGNKSLTYHYKVIGLTKEQINPEALISDLTLT